VLSTRTGRPRLVGVFETPEQRRERRAEEVRHGCRWMGIGCAIILGGFVFVGLLITVAGALTR
jgi:hypothetical protein